MWFGSCVSLRSKRGAQMRCVKMTKLKCAIKFLIKKLNPIDRLSIITFQEAAKRLCPLRPMTDSVRSQVEELVDLVEQPRTTHQNPSKPRTGDTDIIKGLEKGLQVLINRMQKAGRTSAFMLISYGKPSTGITTGMLDSYDVPVHTFGVGDFHDAKVLKQVAERSNNGTFSSVVDLDGSNGAGLSIAMSTCLAGLLTEVVQELELNISSEMKIDKVYTGSYEQRPEKNGSVTILFGNLYCSEKRRILVDVELPQAHHRRLTHAHVFTISYSFRASGREDKLFVSPAIHTSVHSTYNASVSCTYSSLSPEFKVVAVEDARRETMVRISEAVSQKCNAAKRCLIVADAILHRFDGTNDGSEMINELKDEVRQLQNLVGNKQSFEAAGYTFGVASALSHNLQRFAYRGEANEKIIKFPAYVTPIANLFAQQAREFDSNEKFRVPKIEQDIEKLLAPNQTKPGVVNNHQDGVSSGKGSIVSTANKSDYEKVTTFLKKVYAKGWKRKKDKNSNKAVISMALLLLWLLCVMQGKHEEKSEYFESITKCLKALTNLASAIQVLLPGEETIWSLVIEYFI